MKYTMEFTCCKDQIVLVLPLCQIISPSTSLVLVLTFVNAVSSMPRIWHIRLGHPSLNKLVSLQNSLFVSFDTCTDICNICPMAKQKILPSPFNNNFSDSPFNLVHVDIWGPYSIPTHDGFKYFLSIVDDATRCTWIYLLRAKSDARLHLISFHKMVQTQFKANIKSIRSDARLLLQLWYYPLEKLCLHSTTEFCCGKETPTSLICC